MLDDVPASPPTVEWQQLPDWLQLVLSDDQLRLSGVRRWAKVVTTSQVDLTPTQTLVALALLSFMDNSGTAWPSLTRLEGATRLSRRGVVAAIKALEAKCWLDVERGGPGGAAGRPSRYHLRYPPADPRRPYGERQSPPDREPWSPPIGNGTTAIGQDVPPIGHHVHSYRAPGAPEVDLEVSRREKEERVRAASSFGVLPDQGQEHGPAEQNGGVATDPGGALSDRRSEEAGTLGGTS